MKYLLSIMLFSIMSFQAYAAGWHTLDKVSRVTVRGDYFYVKGANTSGHSCVDEGGGMYGTLNHHSSEPGHKKYYSLALTAYTTGKGLSCYIYGTRSNGVCKMENCYIP